MRIALVITELDPGGAENCLTQLACFLAEQGHEVRVFAIGPPPADEQAKLPQQLAACNIPVSFCLPHGRVRSMRTLPSIVRWLKKELKCFDPQVVQSMLFHGNLISALAVDRKRTKFFGGVRVRQPERWRWWVQRWSTRKMQKLICVSDDVARHCILNERVPIEKVTTIPNGVDLVSLRAVANDASEWSSAAAKLGLTADARVLLFVGRLHPQKGVDQLIEHADELLVPLPKHHLVLIGNGPLEQRLREQAAAKQSASRIHFAGWQPRPIAWMSRAELLLLPAVYEGMPNVILEAMAAGAPFVAFEIDGIRQLVGESPIAAEQVAAPGDYVDFAKRVQKLAAAEELRRQCIEVNAHRIEQNFELHHQLAKYIAAYEAR